MVLRPEAQRHLVRVSTPPCATGVWYLLSILRRDTSNPPANISDESLILLWQGGQPTTRKQPALVLVSQGVAHRTAFCSDSRGVL